MKTKNSMKEALIVKKMKAEDNLELPMDDAFFDNLHQNIMAAVDKTDVKPVSKWTKTWVFLERKSQGQRAKARKAAKLCLAAVTLALGASLLQKSFSYYEQAHSTHMSLNKLQIIEEAKQNPEAWSELVANYQDEVDFYAEVLSRSNAETIVEIDQVIEKSL